MNGRDFVRRQSTLLETSMDDTMMIVVVVVVILIVIMTMMTPTIRVVMTMMNTIILPSPKHNIAILEFSFSLKVRCWKQ
jgi:hypothetical protein